MHPETEVSADEAKKLFSMLLVFCFQTGLLSFTKIVNGTSIEFPNNAGADAILPGGGGGAPGRGEIAGAIHAFLEIAAK